MICPRCGTDMLADCPVCHYMHKIPLDEKLIAKLKISWLTAFRRAWDANVMVYEHAKFFLVVFSVVCLGVVLSFVFSHAWYVIVMVNLWVAGMAAYEFVRAKHSRKEASW